LLNDDNSFTAKSVPASGLAQLSESYAQTQSLTAEASLNYNRVIDRHSITALLLYTQTQNSGDALSAARINFPSPALDQLVVGSTVGATNSGTGTQVARKGVVGKLGYTYNDRYLFDFSFRYDGSDVFPPGQRYGFFPALSAGWRISEEKFFRGLMPFVDNLKLRASYGRAGNDRVGQFQYLSTYSIGNGASFGGASATATPVLIPGTIANSNFTWEKAIIRDIGLEATLWKGLLSVEADYYYKRTKDILAPNTAIPAVIGGTLPSQNIATVDNRGFEILLGHQNRIGRVKYNISANATFFKSKVISYPDPAGTLNALKLTGKPVGPDAVTGYQANGLYQSAAEVTGGPTPLYTNVAAGDIRYMDMNKSGAIDANDRVIISRGITPGMMYGFSAGAGYAGFDLTAFFQGAVDTRVYIPSLINNSFYAGYQNLYPYQTDRWTPSNPNASFPRLTVTSKNNQAVSSYWVRNADYLRLKSVEIGYTVPERISRHIRSGGIRFYVNGSNLFTVSKLKIVDPELGNDANANSYPLVQIFNGGASIKF
jgi:TonB-linked SusC/RagA family outer membrane protein